MTINKKIEEIMEEYRKAVFVPPQIEEDWIRQALQIIAKESAEEKDKRIKELEEEVEDLEGELREMGTRI